MYTDRMYYTLSNTPSHLYIPILNDPCLMTISGYLCFINHPWCHTGQSNCTRTTKQLNHHTIHQYAISHMIFAQQFSSRRCYLSHTYHLGFSQLIAHCHPSTRYQCVTLLVKSSQHLWDVGRGYSTGPSHCAKTI